MVMQHTPGPWRYGPSVSSKWYVFGADNHPVYVENVSATNRPRLQRTANAILIAAAPEMLELLRELVKCVKQEVAAAGTDDHPTINAHGKVVVKAEALLSRIDMVQK